MSNAVIKKRILDKIESGNFEDIYQVMGVIEEDINCLDTVFAQGSNEALRIAEDYSEGFIDGPESIDQLVEFIMRIPDQH